MKWFRKAIGKATGRTGREYAETLVTRGYVASREGRLDDALAAFVEACDADETLAIAHFDAGTAELQRFNRDAHALDATSRAARLDAAERWLERAVALDEHHAPAWRALARVRERKGALVAAHAAWTTVVALLLPAGGGAGHDAATHQRPDDGFRAADDEVSVALVEARREQLRLQPAARLQEALGKARAALGGADDEGSRATRQLALDGLWLAWSTAEAASVPQPPHLFALAGALARKAGDLPRARALLDDAVRHDKHDLEAWRELATVCMATGDLKAALAASLAAYRQDPVDAGLVCNVGVCHLALGDRAQAAEFLELARGMAPDDPIVARALAALHGVTSD
jgi:tetratricopeptide (TPR) repeat protein